MRKSFLIGCESETAPIENSGSFFKLYAFTKIQMHRLITSLTPS